MMTRRDGVQQKMLCVTLESLMPQEHFLRRLDSLMDFSFIYQRVESLYSHRGRPSIDPVVVVKMLLLGYMYGIDSERRLEQEVRVNIAYRWFLGIDLDEPVPDHSTFSQLRRRKFNGAALFEELFDEVVRKCIEHGLIDGKLLLTDSTHVRANARNDVVERVAVEAEPSAYLQRLNEQAVKDGVYTKRRKEKKKAYKELVKSPADPDAGFMKRTGKPLGFYYLSHQTCDARHGLITDVHTTPGNIPDSTVHSDGIKRQIAVFGFMPEAVCADSAYDSSEIHKDMLDMGIRTYIPKRNLPKPASGVFSEADFIYDRESDTLTCPNACRLIFSNYRDRLGQKRYKASAGECSACPLRSLCISGDAKYRVVERAYFKWASEEQHMRNDGTPGYYEALRLRKIYCEGNFSHQKAEHNLRRLRKRGLGKAHEHCLLSATALNLKRMVKLLTTRKHPGVSLRKTLSAIGRSSMLYPMALLSTGPFHDTLLHTEKPPYRFTHTAADGLFAEQVAVRPGAGKRQHQHIILDTVNEQPVRENVTFPMAHPIAGQIVIAVFIRQRFAHRQQRHDLFQQFDFQAALDCPLVVLFESGRVLDGVLCFPHFFRSANNSSRSL